MAIEFKVKGLKKGLRFTKKAKSDLKGKLRGANLSAIITVDKWVQKNFKKEGALHDEQRFGPWKPLSQSTLARRRQGSSTILQDTGRLKNGFTFRATSTDAILKNTVAYAEIHEKGKGKIPQRKFMPTDKQAEKIIKPVYEKFAERIVEK